MALGLAGAGENIVIQELEPERAHETTKQIEKLGRKAISVKIDITQVEDIKSMVEKVLDTFGKIYILVNNAGIMRTGKVPEDLDEASWDRNINAI